MTLQCEDVLDRLVEGVTGSVPPGDRAAVVAHLATCPRCRGEAAAVENTAARLREAGRFVTPPGFWPDFMRQLDARLEAEPQRVLIRFRRWLASPRHALGTAAVTVLASLAIFMAVRFAPPRPMPPDPVDTQVRGLVTETMTITLPSLGDILETWRAGLSQEVDQVPGRTGP
jgi:anti-sigma factor RsiW